MNDDVKIVLRGNEFKRVFENRFDAVKKKYGVKKVDIEVLLYLRDHEEKNTPTDVFRNLGLNRGHVSQALDNLIKKGFVNAIPDSHDRRIMHYVVSDDAKSVVKDIDEVRIEFEEKMMEGISQHDLEIYKQVAVKIVENLKNM